MASAYSQPQTYLPYIPTQDINLVNTVLATKEAKFDANVAEMDNLLAEYGNLEIYKDSDKEYLYDRLKTFTDTVNKYGKLDWSRTDVTRNIKNQIKGVLDQRVVKAIGETSRLKQYGASVDQAKEDGTYSDKNYQVGLMRAGFTDWMNDDTGQVKLGNLNYTPFTDVQGELVKSLKQISSFKNGKRVVQIEDPNQPGRLIERTIEGMTQKELEGLIPGLINGKMRDQMNVDGYYRFQGNRQSAEESLRSYHQQDIQGIDTEIKNLQTQINSGKWSAAKVNEAKQQITSLEAFKSSKQQQIESIASQDAGFIGGYLEEQSLVGRLSAGLATEWSQTYKKDDGYFAQLEAMEEQRKSSFQMDGGSSDVTSIPVATDLPDEIDMFNFVKQQGEQLKTERDSVISSQYNSLRPEQKDKVDSLMQSNKYSGLSENGKRFNAMKDAGVLDPETEGALNQMDRKYKAYLEDDERIYTETLTASLQDPSLWDEFQDDSLFGNAGIKIYDEQQNKVTTYKDYLSYRGIKNKDQYKNFISDSARSQEFKARMLSDFLLSSNTASDYTAGYLVNNNLGKVLRGREAGKIDQDLLTQFDRLARVNGENLSFTDLFEVRPTRNVSIAEGLFSGDADVLASALTGGGEESEPVGMDYINEHKNDLKETYSIQLKNSAQATKTYKFLRQALEKGTFDTSTALQEWSRDNSVQDDPQIRKILSSEAAQKAYQEEVAKKGVRIKGANAISIAPSLSSSEKNRVAAFEDVRRALAFRQDLESVDEEQRLSSLKYGVAVQLQRLPSQPDTFLVTQEGKSTTVSQRALMQYPNIARSIDLEEGAEQIVTENSGPLEKTNFSFKPSDEKNNIYLGNRYGFNSMPYLAATKQGAKKILENTYPDMYQPEAPRYWAQTFDTALDNVDKFSVSIQEYGGRNYVEVYYDGEKISDVAADTARGNIEDILDYDPQIFATMALNNIAIELATGNTENFAKLYGRATRQ